MRNSLMNMNMKCVLAIVVLATSVATIGSLSAPALADKDCSVGKALNSTYGTPRDGNELGSVFSDVARSDPGRIGDAATPLNELCHTD